MNWFRLIFIPITLLSCNDTTQKFDKQALDLKRQNIIAFINTAVCSAPESCRWIAVGSKPCGGPSEYFVYPATLDSAKLSQMVIAYSQEINSYNLKWNVVSDCSVVMPPDSVRCMASNCYGYWGGTPKRQS